jgi:uncharacterized surface protein with fasciclin (FAS1) repeats
MELPPLNTLKNIFDRLKANDIAWFKDQWKSGGFGWMKDRLPAGEYDQIGSRVEAGDLSPLKGALGKLDLPGFDLFKGLGGAAAGAAGAVTGAAGAAAGAATAKAGATAAKVGGAATAGVAGAKAVLDGDRNKKKGGFLWVIPALIAAALLAFGLSRCGGSTSSSADTTVAAEDTVVGTDTVAVETVDTTVATETVETTVVAETTMAAETTVAAAAPAAAEGDLLAVAEGAGSFKTLGAAINAAGLTETLKGEGPFTVFAPTDDAFAKLPAGVVDALLKPENKDALTKVLTYHVAPAKVMAADVAAGELITVEGSPLTVTTDGGVKVNGVNVTATDVAASNGVIHVLDGVLVPPSIDITALLGAAAPTTVAAAEAPAAPENLTVYFGNGSAALDAEAQAKIDGAIATLKALPAGSKVSIVGHASPTGNTARNEKLSIARAENVRAALAKGLGEAAADITFNVEARGDSQPDVDEAKSRKVTIEIQP